MTVHRHCPYCQCDPQSSTARDRVAEARSLRRRQAIALDNATRRNAEWTDDDYATLIRTDIGLVEKAELMSRTYYSVKTKYERWKKAHSVQPTG